MSHTRQTPVACLIIAAVLAIQWSSAVSADPPAPGAEHNGNAGPVTDQQVNRAIEKAVAYLWSVQRRDGRWVSRPVEKEYPCMLTAMAGYALRRAGAPHTDWRLRRAAAALQDRMTKVRTPKARSWSLLFFSSLDPAKYKLDIEGDIKFLNLKQAKTGGWTDKAPKNVKDEEDEPGPQVSPITSATTFWALSRAASVGANVFPRMGRREEDYWLGSVNADGGWGLTPSHDPESTITAAGLASLYLLYEQRYLDEALTFNGRFKARCGRDADASRPLREALLRGWDRLERDFGVHEVPDRASGDYLEPLESSPSLRLHMISRAAVASGRKRIGPHVWCRKMAQQLVRTQSVDGSWGSVHETCHGLLAMLNLRRPVLINKLVLPGDNPWHGDPRDAANLTRWLTGRSGRTVTWQSIDLTSTPDDIYDAPILLVSGHEAPTLTNVQRAKLRDFVHAGGTILAVACCSKPEFVDGCRELFATLFPEMTVGPIPEDHAVWTVRDAVSPGDDCLGFHEGCRTAIFILNNGACCAWQQNLTKRYERLFALAGNIAAYATFERGLRGRMSPYFDTSGGPAERTIALARLMHRGDWWVNPDALKHLSGTLSKRIGVGLDVKPAITAGKARRGDAKVLWLSGTRFEPFRSAGTVELKAFLAGGGTLVSSAFCGSESFDASFQAFAATLFGKNAWQRIGPDDPLITGSFAPDLARPLSGIAYRQIHGAPPPARIDCPILYGVRRAGRWIVIHSPYDIHCGVAGHNCLDCPGYTPEDAATVAANILLYAEPRETKQRPDQPKSDTAKPDVNKPTPEADTAKPNADDATRDVRD